MYITEYGIGDVRGQSDAEVIKRLLAISDSRFQDELLAHAKVNGKIDKDKDYQIPASQRLAEFRAKGVLPDFPFGTDLDETELAIAKGLMKLKAQQKSPLALIGSLIRGRSCSSGSASISRRI